MRFIESHKGIGAEMYYTFEEYGAEYVVAIRHGGYHEVRTWFNDHEYTTFHIAELIPVWKSLGIDANIRDQMEQYALDHEIKN